MPVNVDELYERLSELTDNDDVEGAVKAMDAAKAQDPRNVELLHLTARVLGFLGFNEEAIADCDAGLSIDPKYADLWLLKGKCLFRLNEHQAALEASDAYLESIGEEDCDADIFVLRADCFSALSRFEDALDATDEIMDLEPLHPLLYPRRSLYNHQLRDWEATIEDSTKALELELSEGNKLMCLENRGAAFMYTRQFDEALDDLSLAIELDPENWVPYFDRAKVYSITGFPEAALADLNKGVELTQAAVHYAERGEFLFDLDRYEEALSDFEKAVELDPDDPEYKQLRDNAKSVLQAPSK